RCATGLDATITFSPRVSGQGCSAVPPASTIVRGAVLVEANRMPEPAERMARGRVWIGNHCEVVAYDHCRARSLPTNPFRHCEGIEQTPVQSWHSVGVRLPATGKLSSG